MDVKYNTDTKIEDNSRAFKLQKANFDREVNTAVSNANWSRVWRKNQLKILPFLQKAEAQLAYELQAAKIQQKIRNEEIQIQVVERRKQIEIEEQEIRRKEKELMSTVKLPAEAEAYKVQTIAEGKRYVRPCNITQCENYGNLLLHAFVKKFREINAFTIGAIYKSWFDGTFFCESNFLHCVRNLHITL